MKIPPPTVGDSHPNALAQDGDTTYRLLVDSVRDYAILMLDPAGHVTSWNAGAERIKGYRAEDIVGRHFRAFYLAEEADAGRPERILRQAAEAGRYEEEGWRVRKDGGRFRAYVVITALRDADGRLAGFAKVTQDITARWRAEQGLRRSEERLRILVEQIRDYAIFMLDPDGRIATWNLGAERIKGYTADEAIGQSAAVFYTPEDRAAGRFQALLEQAQTQGIIHDVGWRLRQDGSRFWADVTVTALISDSGELYGYAKVVRDLTDRVAAEHQARAYEAAREAIRVRDEFLAIAAHELRTPLTAAQLQLQSLQRLVDREAGAPPSARMTRGLQLALRSTERLSELVETLLDVSRIATGRLRLRLEEFDLVTAVGDAVTRLQAVTEEAGCQVRIFAPETLPGRWDRLRIEQALMNLIANACKYAPQSVVDVGLEADGDRVRLWVRDHGPGIPAEHLDRILGRYERAVSIANYGGLGLGLYVTRQIAETHGGTIRVESTEGVGSTFTLLLPRHTEPEAAEP